MNELQVETYIEAQETPKNNDEIEEYNVKLVDLGLHHLVIKNDTAPIAPISEFEKNVYKTLCPQTTEISKYQHPIPMRALEAYGKCRSYLEELASKSNKKLKIEIWEDEDPDPIMVAKLDWNDYFVIARWGKELQDFPTLVKRAKEKVISETATKIATAREIVNLYDHDKDAFAIGKINGRIENIYF
jgi:hypothetical protein